MEMIKVREIVIVQNHFSWNHVTLGDHALSMLLQISQRVSRETKRLFEIAVHVIKRCANPSGYSLSKPLAFAFVQILSLNHNQICFAKLGQFFFFCFYPYCFLCPY